MIPSGLRPRLGLFVAGSLVLQAGLFANVNLIIFGVMTADASGSGMGPAFSGYAGIGVLTMLAGLLPWLLALPLGVLADRLSRRSALFWTGVLGAAVLGSLAAATAMGAVTLPHLLLGVMVLGLAHTSGQLAWEAHLPAVAGRDRLVPVNAVVYALASLNVFGILFLGDGGVVAAVMAACAVALALSALLFSRVQVPEEPAPPRSGMWSEAVEGVRFTFGHPVLRAIAVYMLGAVAFGFLAQDIVDNPGELGYPGELALRAAPVIGALLAIPLRRFGTLRLAWLAVLVTQPFAVLLILPGPVWYVLGAAVPWLGAAMAAVAVLSHRQAVTPGRLLGRSGGTLIAFVGLGSIVSGLSKVLAVMVEEHVGPTGTALLVLLATAGTLACAVPLFLARRHAAAVEPS